MAERQTIRIAVVRDLDGLVTVAGPDEGKDYGSQMEAAICWHIEAGLTPADKAWIAVELPPVSEVIPEFQAMLEDADR